MLALQGAPSGRSQPSGTKGGDAAEHPPLPPDAAPLEEDDPVEVRVVEAPPPSAAVPDVVVACVSQPPEHEMIMGTASSGRHAELIGRLLIEVRLEARPIVGCVAESVFEAQPHVTRGLERGKCVAG